MSNDDFAHDMRRLLTLPAAQKITKKFLRETMTMSQYNTARAHYGERLRQVLNQDVPDFPPSSARDAAAPASEPTPAQDPAEQDPTEKDRAIVRELALGWGLPEGEVDHVLSYHRDPQRARSLLWKAREQRLRKSSEPSLVESAAD